MMNKSCKFRERGISLELIIYLMFFVTANIIDWIMVLSDIKESENYLATLFIVFVSVIVLIGIMLKKSGIILWHMVSKADCVPLFLLFLLAVIGVPMPDTSYDTLNYHVFWQDSFGQDIIGNHFFPTRVINSLFFCLGDRTYNIFRQLLGYRGGTILGTLALMLIYLQGKIFLQEAYFDRKRNRILASVMSLLCILVEQILISANTYGVDWLAIPFLAEVILRIFFVDTQKNEDIYILGLMAGVCVCIKPSNAVFVFLLFAFYFTKFHQSIRWWIWLRGMVGGLLICVPYVYMSYNMTGNPVFPYMNSLFKSEWFFLMGVDEWSGMKDLFGPASLKEYIFWPYFMVFQSDSIHFADYTQYCGRLLVVLVAVVASIVSAVVTKKRSIIYEASGLFICVYILYLTCLNGHLRYALFMEWFAGVILAMIILALLDKRGLKRHYKVICIGALMLPTILSVGWTGKYIVTSQAFSNKENWVQNVKHLFHDYGKVDLPIADIGGFIVFDTNGSMMSMINCDVPIVNRKSGALTEAGKAQCETVLSNITGRGKTYSLSKPNALIQLANEIEKQGYSIESVRTVKMPTIISANQFCYLVTVKKEKKEIKVYEGNEVGEVSFDASLSGKRIKILIGRKWRDMCDEDTDLKVCIDTNEQIIATPLNTNGEFSQYEVQVPDDINIGVMIKLDTDNLQNKWIIVEYS